MIKFIEYKSGVRLVMEKLDNVRSVSIGIWCNTGSSNELERDFGVSHFIEHMLFKGTDKRSAFDIVNEIDRIGGQQNAFTSKERTCFFVKALDEHFDIAADVLTDMVCNPAFDENEMEREKLVVCEEIKMNADDSDDVAIDNLERIIYKGTPMAHPVFGSSESVMSFTRGSIKEYYRKHYTKDNIVVSVAGSFDEAKVESYFEHAFDSLPAKGENVSNFTLPDSTEVSGYNEINKNIEQAHLAIGIKALPYGDERKYPLRVLNTLLGGGMSSRLFQHIREKKGLAYSIHSSVGANKDSGLFIIEAGVSKDNVDITLESIKEELELLQNHKVPKEEIKSAKEQLKSLYIFSSENVQSRMILNGITVLCNETFKTSDEILNLIDSVSENDIEEVKSIIDNFDNYTIVNVCSNGGQS